MLLVKKVMRKSMGQELFVK